MPQSWLPLPSSRATLMSWQAAAQKMLPASESRGAALGPAPSSLLLLEPLSLPGQKLWSVCPPVLLPPPRWGLFLASEPLGRPVPAGSWWPPSCPGQIPRPAASHGPHETLRRLETTSHDPTAGRQRNLGSKEWAVGSQDYSVSCLLSQSFLVVVLLSFFFFFLLLPSVSKTMQLYSYAFGLSATPETQVTWKGVSQSSRNAVFFYIYSEERGVETDIETDGDRHLKNA